jgi:hypothetical protein
MPPEPRQGDLFAQSPPEGTVTNEPQLALSASILRDWQRRIQRHQAPLFAAPAGPGSVQQTQLFASAEPLERFAPLTLQPLPLSFWRWPESPHQGPAIYLVMDRPEDLSTPILLYVGETVAADRRWKGEHDCKSYLASYSEALSAVGLRGQTSIRFWGDVPRETRSRRRLEQQLIQTWLPPFNKETRERWATPFNADG